jgi:hypothetical protein
VTFDIVNAYVIGFLEILYNSCTVGLTKYIVVKQKKKNCFCKKEKLKLDSFFFLNNKMIDRGPLLLPSPTSRMKIKQEKEEDEEKLVPLYCLQQLKRFCVYV